MTETRLRDYYCSECWFYNEASSPRRILFRIKSRLAFWHFRFLHADCCTAPHKNKGMPKQETERLIGDFWERGCKKEEARAVHVVAPGAKACLAFKSFEEGLQDHKEEVT